MTKGRAYNYEFKMLMEGVSVPFKSANIVCTPNGVEFNINVHVNKELFDLKPKTAVQIFFREWYGSQKAWRLMADGFFSGFVTGEDSTGGRAVGITCRDFRMDIRKSPAAIAWASDKEMVSETSSLYSISGIYQNVGRKVVTTSKDSGKDTVSIKGVPTRLYDGTGLIDLATAMERIVGTSYGKDNDEGGRFSAFNFTTSEIEDANGTKKANGGLFLDAFIRGIWMEAVGGTRVNSFLNKRIRADKRFLVPRNYASFNFWRKNNFGLEIGTAILGGAKFSSLEAAMMNVAGMFSCRVYSCSTPSLISLEKDDAGVEFVMDDTVRKFMDTNGSEFGAMYMLNETMLLPPLEFTAPPNCNLFFPPMYNKIGWRRDDDSDITRAYFSVVHSLTAASGHDWGQVKFQIPNDMFGVTTNKVKGTDKRLPLTLEERYKGVNVYHGSVGYNLAAADAAKTLATSALNKKGEKKVEKAKVEAKKSETVVKKSSLKSLVKGIKKATAKVLSVAVNLADKLTDKAETVAAEEEVKSKKKDSATATAYKRHAMIKYINNKYVGRVVTIDMAFNPFVMAGFPGAVISAEEEMDTNVTKTIIGMVQQVSHAIHITSQGADASTSVIMNNARFEDEPTDLDIDGMPLYIEATDKEKAEVNIDTLEFVKENYRVPDAKSLMSNDESSDKFDIKEVEDPEFKFAKDFLTTSAEDLAKGKDENTYVDTSYEPNRIFKFYEQVFGRGEHHFMLGNSGGKYFAYNSMHEALVKLRDARSDLMRDYSACMTYVKRDICSADAFFHGILGLSSEDRDDDLNVIYVNRKRGFRDSAIEETYFGVSSDDYDKGTITKGLHMSGPGQFSSIREHTPITAFIKERRNAVRGYKQSAIKTAAGVVFNGQ